MGWHSDELSDAFDRSAKIRLWEENQRLKEEIKQAYARGAEAMREKAAQYLEDDAKFESVRMSIAAEIYAGVIRSMPIPEDK